ncbi:cytochrome c biogenesis CcdA family protein [Corynebacterium sp. HS2168-gen11]|uniref:cytochrome c biogenesis CcdA family protein n=1 Tax=Corynebacterium sp. HS2168-gen11 TaxID=2974027 RepID=UPI00216ABA1E|nr:cytochrome c biogenesis CcdA family protein [Corynebacterium sp. HS2168-gen11]MCS4535597.1 cytochrome c biogenesis CcdA family protein [Corynebacterium sp. HS2168-gen11]
MIDIGILGAFLGGILALLSPCSALLLPAFFAYAFQSAGALLTRTFVFFLGLAAIMVPLGVGAGSVGAFLLNSRDQLILIGGLIIIALGVVIFFGGGFRFTVPIKLRGSSLLSTFSLGALYGFSGFCTGPLLGAVLTTAVVGGSALYGAFLLATYAFGMTVPLLFLAFAWNRWDLGNRRWIRGTSFTFGPFQLHSTSMISGLLFITIGTLFIFSHGSADLPQFVSLQTQARVQEWLVLHAGTIPNSVILLIAGIILAVGLFISIIRNSHTHNSDKH